MISFLYFIYSFISLPDVFHCNYNFIRTKEPFLISNNTLESSLEPPLGGELKLLTHLNAESWAHNWILFIANSGVIYDDHYYLDYFTMKAMANVYTSSGYFYLGFFPDSTFKNEGPKYIGLFDLQHKKRIFNTKCIIENPYYLDEESQLHIFKQYIINLTNKAFVFLDYSELNTPGQIRYYLEWKLN